MRSLSNIAFRFIIFSLVVMVVAGTKEKEKSTASDAEIKQEPRSSPSPERFNSASASNSPSSLVGTAKIKPGHSHSSATVTKPVQIKPSRKAMKIRGRGYYSHSERDARNAIRTLNGLKLEDRYVSIKKEADNHIKKEGQ